MQLIDRIMLLINALGFKNQTEFMRDLELSHTTIGQWKKNKNIDHVILSLIECKYNVSRAWLRDGTGDMFNEKAAPSGLSAEEQTLISLFKQLPQKDKIEIINMTRDKRDLTTYRAAKSQFIGTQVNVNHGDVNNYEKS